MAKKIKNCSCADSIFLGGTINYPTSSNQKKVPPKGNASAQLQFWICYTIRCTVLNLPLSDFRPAVRGRLTRPLGIEISNVDGREFPGGVHLYARLLNFVFVR